jgi:hypothetical protein
MLPLRYEVIKLSPRATERQLLGWEVANQRLHGTTRRLIRENWETEQQSFGEARRFITSNLKSHRSTTESGSGQTATSKVRTCAPSE